MACRPRSLIGVAPQWLWRLRLPDHRHQPVFAVVPHIDHDEDCEHQSGDERGLEPQVLRRPEEIDPVQEADEQWRVPERGQRAADIGHEKDEKDDHMDVVEPVRVRANERADQDHGRAGGPDNARAQRAECQDRGVDKGRAAQVAGHENAAGDHVERKQQHDKAQILRQHRMHERGERDRRPVEGSERRERQHAPGKGELAVVVMPDSRKQQRAGRDGEQDADEGQRPWPAQCGAVESCGGQRAIGR